MSRLRLASVKSNSGSPTNGRHMNRLCAICNRSPDDSSACSLANKATQLERLKPRLADVIERLVDDMLADVE